MPKIFGIQVGQKTGVELAIDEAIVLIGEQRYDDAIRVIEDKALAREPDDRRSILHLGLCYMLKGEVEAEFLDRAEEFFRPLLERRGMDSEKAAAEIALDKIRRLRAGFKNG